MGATMDQSKESPNRVRVDALLRQWEHFDGMIDRIESQYFSVPVVVVTVLAAANFYASSEHVAIQGVMGALVLAVSAAVLAYLAYQMRRVAFIRGYLRVIEKRLNEVLGSEVFRWNSTCVPRYLGNNWMNYLMPFALCLAFVTVCLPAIDYVVGSYGISPVSVGTIGLSAVMVFASIASLFFNGDATAAVERGEEVHLSLFLRHRHSAESNRGRG